MTGQLCLKWNNHATAFNKLLDKIYLQDSYSDGTILCQGKFYPVHRFVLSTCSDYFEEMFRQCVRLNNKHPFIIVKDINPEQMEALLNYMYRGEVNVPQEMLPELIKAAEAFKIKGLAVPDEESPKYSKKRSSMSSSPSLQKRSRMEDDTLSKSKLDSSKRAGSDNNINLNSDQSFPSTSNPSEDSMIPKIKTEPIDFQEPSIDNSEVKNSEHSDTSLKFENSFSQYDNEEGYFENFNDNATKDELEPSSWENSQDFTEVENGAEDDQSQRLTEMSSTSSMVTSNEPCQEKAGSLLKCQFRSCNYQTVWPSYMKLHLRIHTGEKPFKCPHCPFRSAQKNNIGSHIKAKHSDDRPFSCSLCSYKTVRKCGLKNHMFTQHKSFDQ